MDEPAVLTARHGRTLVVELNRTSKRNAINADVTAGLDAALNEIEDDDALWCGILAARGPVFCAGADLAEGPGDATPRGGMAGLITRRRSKPLLAAVEGRALGGGFELVMCCDLVVASTTATFGLPEARRGLMPDFGGAFRVARLLPPMIARELLLTTDELDAARAERLGMVNRLVEPGTALAQALALAERVCTNAPLALRASLAVHRAGLDGDESSLWTTSDAAHEGLLGTQDLAEGLNAFFERRSPSWQGM